jgi:DNA-binding NarL/FixJ family response regulator
MVETPIEILLVEDNPGDVDLLRQILAEYRSADELHNPIYRIIEAEKLADALELLATADFDLVILDLGLPDSGQLNSLREIREASPETPAIVLTGLDDESVGVSAVRQGAQDYLIKGQVEGALLTRAIRYAIDRCELQKELDRSRRREENEREQAELARRARRGAAARPTPAAERGPLRAAAPEAFEGLIEAYGKELDRAVEREESGRRAEGQDHRGAREIALRLASLGAGGEDVLEMHVRALQVRDTPDKSMKRSETYSREGRFLLVEVMGLVVDRYREAATAGEDDPGKGRTPARLRPES